MVFTELCDDAIDPTEVVLLDALLWSRSLPLFVELLVLAAPPLLAVPTELPPPLAVETVLDDAPPRLSAELLVLF